MAAVGAILGFAGLVARDVYAGVPASVTVSDLSASCVSDSPGVDCGVSVTRLNAGRFRVATSVPATSVTMRVADGRATARTRFVLARSTVPGRLVVVGTGGGDSPLASGDVVTRNARYVLVAPAAPQAWDSLGFKPAPSNQPTVIEELGFFESRRGLLRSELQPIQAIPAQLFFLRYVAIATLLLCVWCAVAGWFLAGHWWTLLSPWLAAALCLGIGTLELGTTFSPYWGRDLRSFYASEWLPIGPDSNLTSGLYEGSRLVQGLGETVRIGMVQWHRMPGYGLFCGMAALVGRTSDVIDIAANVILLQLLLFAAAAGLFVFAAQRMLPPWVAWLLGVLIAMLPKQLAYTQADSVIMPIQLLVLAALLVYLAAERDGSGTFTPFVLVNLACALWFAMRTDVLPGWTVLAIVLAGGRWRRLALPVVLALTIAVPWAMYKKSYRHEFDLLPTNTGEVVLLSLCEVSGTFPFECTDVGYVDWARRGGHFDPATSQASSHAVAEVVRHWVTYPVHFGFMVFSKARRSITTESFPGFQTRFNRLYGVGGDTWMFVLLLTAAAAALAVNHQRRRTLLLGWAVVLNMPVFFVTFASAGRFYPAAGVSLLVATVPLVCDRSFYASLARHPWRTAAVIVCVAAFVGGGSRVEQLVRTHDALHYWAPLLDPGRSTLRFTGH